MDILLAILQIVLFPITAITFFIMFFSLFGMFRHIREDRKIDVGIVPFLLLFGYGLDEKGKGHYSKFILYFPITVILFIILFAMQELTAGQRIE